MNTLQWQKGLERAIFYDPDTPAGLVDANIICGVWIRILPAFLAVGVTQHDIESKRHKKEVDMLRDLQLYIDGNLKRSGSFRQRSGSFLLQNLRELWANFIAASKMPNAVMMHIAAANGYLDAMDLLLKNKFPVNLEDEDGWQPIHAAVAWNQVRRCIFILGACIWFLDWLKKWCWKLKLKLNIKNKM